MATAGVQVKLMPSSLDIDLVTIKEESESVIGSFKTGVFTKAEDVPIAFGLKAVVVTFALSEAEEVDLVLNKLGEIEGVSSVELLDYRRAVG